MKKTEGRKSRDTVPLTIHQLITLLNFPGTPAAASLLQSLPKQSINQPHLVTIPGAPAAVLLSPKAFPCSLI
jgi:hypothetical protein